MQGAIAAVARLLGPRRCVVHEGRAALPCQHRISLRRARSFVSRDAHTLTVAEASSQPYRPWRGLLRPSLPCLHQLGDARRALSTSRGPGYAHASDTDDSDNTGTADGEASTAGRKPRKPPVEVGSIRDVTKALRQVLLRVHPDAVARFPAKVVDTNQKSMQSLQALMTGTLPALTPMQPHPPLGLVFTTLPVHLQAWKRAVMRRNSWHRVRV